MSDENQEPDENVILYLESFSHFSKYLIDLFKGTKIKLIQLDSVEDIYDYTDNQPKLFIADIPLELGLEDDFIYLNNYITCPKIYILENIDELNLYFDELSKYGILGLAKDSNLKERLYGHLSQLELVGTSDLYFEVTNLDIDSFCHITCRMNMLEEGQVTIAQPLISEFKEFDTANLSLPNFNIRFNFDQSDSQIVEEQLKIKTNTEDLFNKLKVFDFQNELNIETAYVADNPPRYQVFNGLNVKANYYNSYEAYQGKEDLILVEDKKLGKNRSLGTEISKLKNKSILIFGRVFPLEYYLEENSSHVKTTTNVFDLNAIKDILKTYHENHTVENSYHFDVKNDLARAQIKVGCKLNTINETFVTIDLPFKLQKTCKVQIDFFGKKYMTVLDAMASNTGYTVQCQLDGFSETEVNHIRQLLNKLYYLVSKQINLSQFKSIEDVFEFDLSTIESRGEETK